MVNILHVQLMPMLSGAQKVTLDEMRLLGSEYNQTLICSGYGQFTDEAEKLGVKVVCIESLVREVSLKKDLASFIAIYKFIKKNKFDIVHTHSSKTGVIGRVAAKLSGVKKIVHTVHGFAYPAANSKVSKFIFYLMDFIAAFCTDHLIVMNDADLKLARKVLPLRNDKIKLINNGVDVNAYHNELSLENKNEQKKDLGMKTDKINIVSVGRLSQQKNPELLLKAFNEIDNEDVELYFIGDGPLHAPMVEYTVTNAITDRIHFLGWRKDVQKILPLFDIFILASRWEGMPLAILESMAASVPVICSDIPSNKFLIESTSGLLFESDNAADLVSKINLLVDDSKLRSEHATRAFNKIQESFDLNKRIEILKLMYRS